MLRLDTESVHAIHKQSIHCVENPIPKNSIASKGWKVQHDFYHQHNQGVLPEYQCCMKSQVHALLSVAWKKKKNPVFQ